jgi:intracellular septation protein A
LPRPRRLALSAGWNLAESLGLPVAGYLVGEAVAGSTAGMVAATIVVWLTAAVRKVTTRSVPQLLLISALVLTVQTGLVLATGAELFFLLQFPLANVALCVMFARTAPTSKPLVAQLAAEVVALRQPSSRSSGLDKFFRDATWLWAGIFAASAVGLALLMAIESVNAFLLLTTAITVGGIAVGTALSAVWFIRAMRRFGLHVRFTNA